MAVMLVMLRKERWQAKKHFCAPHRVALYAIPALFAFWLSVSPIGQFIGLSFLIYPQSNTMTLTCTEHVPMTGAGESQIQYMVYFSSGSPPWCPDCVDALPHIRAVFETNLETNGADAYLVLVGQRAE